jgi:hypothetical protein
MCSVKRLTLATLGIALLTLVLAAPAFGRPPGVGGTLNPYNYYDPYGYSRQAAFNITLYGRAMRHVPPYALGYNPYVAPYYPPYGPFYGDGAGSIVNNPVSGTGYSPGYSPGYSDMGYGSGYYPSYDPLNSLLQGAASVMNADGRFRINDQQARLIREQVKSAHIDNRRKAFDEFLYERANTPTWLDDVERQRKLNMRAALDNPPASEILDAISLNTLLDGLRNLQARGVEWHPVNLNEDMLKQINVTAGAGANPGLLKPEKLTWPLSLTGTEFTEDRKAIERNLSQAINEVAASGRADAGRLRNLNDDLERMTDALTHQIGDMTPTQYIDAKNYLQQLTRAVKALSGPDAAEYVSGNFAAKGKTVGELVKNMAGLRFAPATPGTERAYKYLQEKLAEGYQRSQPSRVASGP